MKNHALSVIFEKRQNLKLSSAANYRWRFMGLAEFVFLGLFRKSSYN